MPRQDAPMACAVCSTRTIFMECPNHPMTFICGNARCPANKCERCHNLQQVKIGKVKVIPS